MARNTPHDVPPRLTSLLSIGISLLLTGACSAASSAASIDWGLATQITGDSDVAASGTILAAYNFGNGEEGTTVINGVTFQNAFPTALGMVSTPVTLGTGPGTLTISGSPIFSGNPFGAPTRAPFSSLSAPYQTLLNSGLLGGSGGAVLTLSIGGLTPGQTYRIQVWSNDSRVSGVTRTTTFASGSEPFVTLRQSTAAANTSGGLGQYVFGTFTADSTTQTFDVTGNSSLVLNGIVITAVPEPGVTGAAMGLALLAFLAVRRRTRQARQS